MILRVADMSRALADAMAAATEAHAGTLGIRVAVVVVDRGGHLVVARRMDGAPNCAFPIAQTKAETAAATLAATEAWLTATQPGHPDWGFHTALAGRFTCMPGGVPVTVDGEVVGAIGVSGGESVQDAECARAGLAMLDA